MIHKCTYRSRCDAFVLLTILHICQKFYGNDASVQFPQQTIENEFVLSEAQQNKIKQVALPTDQELIVRLPSNTLLKYSSYKDVSILHFRVPSDARAAYFSFKAVEESKSPFQRQCNAKDVTVHLKANSLPVISPENITFPNNFLSPEQRFEVYHLQFESNSQQQRIDVQGPQMGSWFAVAFISWTNPSNERIEQQGLSASCDTLLVGELSVSRFSSTIVNDGQIKIGNLTSRFNPFEQQRNNITRNNIDTGTKQTNPFNNKQHTYALNGQKFPGNGLPHFKEHYERQTDRKSIAAQYNEDVYKFYVPEGVNVATAVITFKEVCKSCPDIAFYTQVNAFPLTALVGGNTEGNEYNYMHIALIRPNQTEEISIGFYVQPKSWHYALLKFVNQSNTAEDVLPLAGTSPRQENAKVNASIPEYKVSYKLRIVYKETNSQNAITNTTAKLSEREKLWQPQQSYRKMDFYSLLRQSYHEFFMFDYDLQPDANGTVPALLNLTAKSTVGFAFELGEVYDIGGTLTFAVSMKHDLRFRSELKSTLPTTSPSERGILAEKLVGDPDETGLPKVHKSLNEIAQSNQSMQIIVCMHHGVSGVPTWPDKCRYGQRLMQATSVVNNTDFMGLIHVPFPESGLWYVTMGLFCHEAETARANVIDSVKEFVRTHSILLQEMRSPCACATNAKRFETCIRSKDCLDSMNETETLKVKECMMDFKCTDDYIKMTQLFETHHKSATEQHFALDNCSTSVIFSISSSPCVAGQCGRFGRCYNYMSGGFVFSTCLCLKGYRGWDCTEESQVPSSMSILLASLLLTLSNLLFIPSVFLSVKRQFYTEGLIYFFAMFFSIFYHACDSGEDEFSFCLVKIGVLQFCDFYCGLLAIWVTLIAMTHIPQQIVSLLHMFGAILLAFGTELDKQSLWVFLAPALTGICLISTSWGIRCSKSRKCFPARQYLIIYMPLGMVLVMIGLVCYAFLQTKQNYHVVHSVWHMVMALSIMCLLPSRKTFIPKYEHSDL